MWNFVYIYFHYGHFQTENIWIFMQKIMLLKMFNFWRQNSNIIKEKIRKKSGNFCVTKYFILTTILRIWKSTLKWLKLNIIKNRWFLARKFKYFQFWIDHNSNWFFRKKIVKIIGEQIFKIFFMFLNLNFRAKIMVLYLAGKVLTIFYGWWTYP